MPIPRALADQLVVHVGDVLGKQFSVTDENGIVVGSAYPDKVGIEYPSAQEALASNKPVNFTNEHKPVVALPFRHSDDVHGALLVHDEWENVQEQVKVIRSLSELLTDQFLKVTSRMADADDQLLFTLLNSDKTRLPDLMAEAAVLGYNLEKPRLVIVVRAVGFSQKLAQEGADRSERETLISSFKHSLYTSLTNFFTRSIDNIVGYLGHDRFVILKDLSDTDEQTVVKLLTNNFDSIFGKTNPDAIRLGIGQHYPGVSGIQDSYKEGVIALETGERLKPDRAVHYTADLHLPLLLAHAPNERMADFVQRIIGNLDKHQKLVSTVQIFFQENLSLTDAAVALKVHRNTLIYRLDRIAELTGLDPRNFLDALHLYTALLLRRMQREVK